MITVEFIWDEGDPSVGMWPGWEVTYAVIESGEGFRTIVSFEVPTDEVGVECWSVTDIETVYHWEQPCSACHGTGDAPYKGGAHKGEPMGRCYRCKNSGVEECQVRLSDNGRPDMKLKDLPPIAVAVKREWDRINLLEAVRRLEEDAAYSSEYVCSLQATIDRGEGDGDTLGAVKVASQESNLLIDQYNEAKRRYESIYGESEETV